MLPWYLPKSCGCTEGKIAPFTKRSLMEKVFHQRNRSLGRGKKSNECKHWSKPLSCSKRILRKLAQWVTMSSFSLLGYWKNLPLWELRMCLCWVRAWHSSFSTHFYYKKKSLLSFATLQKFWPEHFLCFVGFYIENVGTVVLCFTWKVVSLGLGWVHFPTCNIWTLCILLFAVQLLFIYIYTNNGVCKGCKCVPAHACVQESRFEKFAESIAGFFCWTSWGIFNARLAATVWCLQPAAWEPKRKWCVRWD